MAKRTSLLGRSRPSERLAREVPLLLQRQARYAHAGLQPADAQVGHCDLPRDDKPQGRIEHEASPRPGYCPEERLVYASSPPQGHAGRRPTVWQPCEVDETYIGGKEANKHEYKKQRKGRGPVGKAASALMAVDPVSAATSLQPLRPSADDSIL